MGPYGTHVVSLINKYVSKIPKRNGEHHITFLDTSLGPTVQRFSKKSFDENNVVRHL